jgi:hypothetical protein
MRVPGWRLVLWLAACSTSPVRAQAPATYAVGAIPIAAGGVDLEFPLAGDFRGQVGLSMVSQGTFDDHNPFAYLSAVSPTLWVHYDGVRNLRLSLAVQELWTLSIPPLRSPSGREDRLLARGRLQQPFGSAAIYELAQLDLRRFDDAAGVSRIVVRPRFRLGVGFNLDAARVHSLTTYQEVAFRFGDDAVAARKLEFLRTFLGYGFTPRSGTFVTVGVFGQISLSPDGTSLTVFYGPALSITYRAGLSARAAAARPEPPDPQIN